MCYRYVYGMTLLHFLKREYETLFVHRFSNGTMPLYGLFRKYVFLPASEAFQRVSHIIFPIFADPNLFRSCAHYWILSGVALAYAVYGPTYAATSPYIRGTIRSNPTFLWSCIAVWTVSTQFLPLYKFR